MVPRGNEAGATSPLPTAESRPGALPPPPSRLEGTSPLASVLGSSSTLHFLVHPAMVEVQREAEARDWFARGFTSVSVEWLELRWTTDGWHTTHVVHSTDVPCPVVSGVFHLKGCPPGTAVEFAVHAGIACHAPHDTAGVRETGDLWFNDEGRNYRQVTK